MTDAWVSRYLDLLELEPAEPDLALLRRLTHQHLSHVAFENVSAILRRRSQADGPLAHVDPETLLDRWRTGRAGGLCFDVTEMLGELLRRLGYRTHPVLARISFPGSHQALVVDEARLTT